MKNKSDILLQLIEYYTNGNKRQFAKMINITPQNLSNWITNNTFDVYKLTSNLPDINESFILTGEGEMLKSKNIQNITNNSGTAINGDRTHTSITDNWERQTISDLISQNSSLLDQNKQTISDLVAQNTEILAQNKQMLVIIENLTRSR